MPWASPAAPDQVPHACRDDEARRLCATDRPWHRRAPRRRSPVPRGCRAAPAPHKPPTRRQGWPGADLCPWACPSRRLRLSDRAGRRRSGRAVPVAHQTAPTPDAARRRPARGWPRPRTHSGCGRVFFPSRRSTWATLGCSGTPSSPASRSRHWPPAVPTVPAAREGDELGARRVGVRCRRGQQFECQRQRRIAGQDGGPLVESPVHRGLAAPHVVVVHGRQIVVDERIAVHALKASCSRRSERRAWMRVAAR